MFRHYFEYDVFSQMNLDFGHRLDEGPREGRLSLEMDGVGRSGANGGRGRGGSCCICRGSVVAP